MVKQRWFIFLIVIVALVSSTALAQDMAAPTISLGSSDELGPYLVGPNGMTLYTFANDEPGASSCVDQCAANWPPLTLGQGEVATLADGISGVAGAIERADGSLQVTYNGQPLYYWINDAAPGDTTGHLVNDVWFAATMPDVGLAGNDELGEFLVGANGMTLYTFANDAPGVSNCVDQCAANWPPLTVESADALTTQPGLPAAFGVIERADGAQQVTVNDMPLYYWVNDAAPGDSTGHLVNDVWFAAKLPTVASAANDEFGAILTGPNGMSLYTFADDSPGVTTCYDFCAIAWPPLLLAAGEEPSAGEGVMGALGTIERSDGTLQVTYNDLPLYYWFDDVLPGDTTGHLVEDVWFIAQP